MRDEWARRRGFGVVGAEATGFVERLRGTKAANLLIDDVGPGALTSIARVCNSSDAGHSWR